MTHFPFSRPLRRVVLAILLPLAPVSLARAQTVDQDFEFAAKLVEKGFPDFANKLMQQVVERNPDQRGRALVIKAEGFIAARKFADAENVIKELPANDPKADAIRLALANGYYRINELERSKQLYQEFFGRFQQPPTDPDLVKFYRESAYRFAQMLQMAGDLGGAAEALGKVLATNPDRDVARSMMAEQAQLLVDQSVKGGGDRDKLLAQATKICQDIQWGGVDLWFGQSIITLANIELAKGNRARAKDLINKQYRDILREIDKQLKERGDEGALNPTAGSRFLMGQMYEAEANEILKDAARRDEGIELLGKALGEYYNVFVRYGESDRGPEAGVRANALKVQLEGMGKTVDIDLGAQAEKAAATQFRLADNLFRQQKHGEAVVEYLKALNAYPETSTSLRSLGYLLQAYINVGDTLMARAVAGYLAERFAGKEPAAVALLAAATITNSKKDEAATMALYDLYLKQFPEHEKAGTILFFLGSQRRKAGDNDGANHFFQRIVDHYPKDQYYPQALRLIARSYYDLGQYEPAIAAFAKLVGDIPPGPDRASAQFTLADAYVKMGQWPKAALELKTLMDWLSPKDNPYAATDADREKNRTLLERASFQRANAFARITEPAERVPQLRAAAQQLYEQFLSQFPKSELAPKAMMGLGQMQMGLGQMDAAARTFDRLAADYPESEEGKNALFSLARSAMEIGQFDQARMAFEKMAAARDNYTPDEFARIGQLMIDAKLYDQALQAFRFVSEDPKILTTKDAPESRGLLERALFGVGRANFVRRNFDEAIKALEQLLQEYPRSGLFFEARFMLGEAYAMLGNFLAASQSLSDIFRFSNDPIQINQASLKLAEVQLKAGDKTGALASYQRVALLSDPNKQEQRPYIEQALRAGIGVALEIGRHQEAVESCDQYLKLYPTSEKVPEVRRQRAEASLRASTGGETPPAATP